MKRNKKGKGEGEGEEEEEMMKKRDDRTRPEGHRHRRNASWPAFALIFFSYSRSFSFSFSLRHAPAPAIRSFIANFARIARPTGRECRASPGRCALARVNFLPKRTRGKSDERFRCSLTARKASRGRPDADRDRFVVGARAGRRYENSTAINSRPTTLAAALACQRVAAISQLMPRLIAIDHRPATAGETDS